MFVKQWTSKYVSAFRYVPSDSDLLVTKGEVYCFINLIVKTSYPVDRITKMVWDSLIDEYTYSQSGPLEALKKAIKAGEKKAVSLIKNDKELEAAAVNLSYTMIVVKDSNLYIARLGEHSVNLFRNGKYINLTEILDKHNVDAGSAMIEPDDVIIVTAGEVGKLIPLQQFSTDRVSKLADLMSESEGIMLVSGKEIQVPDFAMKKGENRRADEIEKPQLVDKTGLDETIKEEINETEPEEVIEPQVNALDEEVKPVADEDIIDEIEDSQVGEVENVENVEQDKEDNAEIDHKIEYIEAANPQYDEESLKDDDYAVSGEKPSALNIRKMGGSLVNNVKSLNIKGRVRTGADRFNKTTPVIKRILSTIVKIIGKVAEKIGSVFSAIGDKIKQLLDGALGRKLWYKRLMSRLSQTRLSIGGSNVRGMKVDYYRDRDIKKRRFGIAFLAVTLIIILIFGVNYTRQIQHESDVNARATVFLKDANTFYSNADRNANDKQDSAALDLVSASEQIKKVDDLLTAEKVALSIDNQKTYNTIKNGIQTVDDKINRRVALSEPSKSIELLLDTKISFGDKSQPTDMSVYRNASSNEFLFVSDKGEKAVFRINLSDNKVLKLPDSGKVLAGPQFVSAGVSGVYVYDSGAGVVRSGFNTSNGFDDFAKLTGLGADAFSGKNISALVMLQDIDTIYLLDRSTGTLLRSIRNVPDFTYGLLQKRYENTAFSLGNKILADDQNVFVIATGSNGLIRYSGGEIQQSAITQVNPEVQDLTAGYAHELGTGGMYVFDKPSKRILKLEKPVQTATDQLHPGEYVMLKQYVYRGDRTDVFNDVKSLMVDYAEKNMYVLDGLKVWKIPL